MPVIRLAVTALGVAATVARHPAVRVALLTITTNPRARELARDTVMTAAYGAGVVARRVISRKLIR